MITIPKHYIYAPDNSHTQRDDEIATKNQGIIVRRFEYESCRLVTYTQIGCAQNDSKFLQAIHLHCSDKSQ